MKYLLYLFAVVSAVIMIACPTCLAGDGGGMNSENDDSALREKWEIRVKHGERREFIFTNKLAAHFSGEAAGANSRSYHGLFCSMHEYLDSWEISAGGRKLDFDDISQARAYPHYIKRKYSRADLEEEIVLPDERNGLMVRFSTEGSGDFILRPWVDMRFIWKVPKPEYRIFWEKENNILLISRDDNSFPKDIPRWIAITSSVKMDFKYDGKRRKRRYPKDAARNAMAEAFPFSPGYFVIEEGQREDNNIEFIFALGGNENEAADEALQLLNNFNGERDRKLARLEKLLAGIDPPFEDRQYLKAFRWAFASIDNLIMNQRGRGIYAGFHWFPTFWGRDQFISLPGACLVTGRLEIAEEILTSFLEYQKSDRDDPHLGRVPNIVNPDNLQYEGVDGTWWLVRAAWKYVLESGDREFLLGSYGNIRLALNGALEKAVDELGFLRHEDWETWMDAGGSSHPYSPRGDRAVEIQALFHYGLLAGAGWAGALADGGFSDQELEELEVTGEELRREAAEWMKQASLLQESFRTAFWNRGEGYLYDHLDRDGTPDEQIRPNALLAMMVSLDEENDFAGGQDAAEFIKFFDFKPLLTTEMKERVVDRALEGVILEHGVTSLTPEDPDFHPFHLDLENYFYDEAYHNGDVWEWLTGPAITCMTAVGRHEEARALFAPLVNEILNEACVGSLREIQDGKYTPGKEEFGGATSQAWSLAEFIRASLRELHGAQE